MKTIASLTMIYLPSTFAASIFSTGFFTYSSDPTTGSQLIKVNPQIWKLIAIALGLSVLTIGVWIWLNKKGTPRIFNWARQGQPETGDELPTTAAAYTASGALGEPVVSSKNETKTHEEEMSIPKISLPVPIPGDMA